MLQPSREASSAGEDGGPTNRIRRVRSPGLSRNHESRIIRARFGNLDGLMSVESGFNSCRADHDFTNGHADGLSALRLISEATRFNSARAH